MKSDSQRYQHIAAFIALGILLAMGVMSLRAVDSKGCQRVNSERYGIEGNPQLATTNDVCK